MVQAKEVIKLLKEQSTEIERLQSEELPRAWEHGRDWATTNANIEIEWLRAEITHLRAELAEARTVTDEKVEWAVSKIKQDMDVLSATFLEDVSDYTWKIMVRDALTAAMVETEHGK
jgi:hypothetical protein